MAKAESVPEPFRRFQELTKKVVNVPKKDVDKKEQERPKRRRKPKAT